MGGMAVGEVLATTRSLAVSCGLWRWSNAKAKESMGAISARPLATAVAAPTGVICGAMTYSKSGTCGDGTPVCLATADAPASPDAPAAPDMPATPDAPATVVAKKCSGARHPDWDPGTVRAIRRPK